MSAANRNQPSDSQRSNVAFIGVGSNIDPRHNIPAALRLLQAHVRVTQCSTFFRTRAIGRSDQPDFFNGVWQIETLLEPEQLKASLLPRVEDGLGRTRTSDKFDPRTIDLDLLLYNDLVVRTDHIMLPHPDLGRPFVFLPVIELLDNMAARSNAALARTIKALLPPPPADADPGRPLAEFTQRLRELIAGDSRTEC